MLSQLVSGQALAPDPGLSTVDLVSGSAFPEFLLQGTYLKPVCLVWSFDKEVSILI